MSYALKIKDVDHPEAGVKAVVCSDDWYYCSYWGGGTREEAIRILERSASLADELTWHKIECIGIGCGLYVAISERKHSLPVVLYKITSLDQSRVFRVREDRTLGYYIDRAIDNIGRSNR
jgi:hypothetical protein